MMDMAIEGNIERRQNKRHKAIVSAIITNIDKHPLFVEFAETMDISQTGALLSVKRYIDIASHLQISLFLPNNKGTDDSTMITSTVKVVRRKEVSNKGETPIYNIGIQYLSLGAENSLKLKDFFDRLQLLQ